MKYEDFYQIAIVAIIILAVSLAVCLWPGKAEARRGYQCEAQGVPSQYDKTFKRAVRRHYPSQLRHNWCTLKALCWTESRLNPKAESPVGAQGLCQVMPATAGDLVKRNLWRGNLRRAKQNAEAAAIVFRRNWEIWAVPRSTECRYELAAASYNAGAGNIIRAQTLSGGRLCWEGIRPHLRDVTGHHARETTDYVDRQWKAYRKLRGYGL